MNKEALRKELEDCWKAAEEYAASSGYKYKVPNEDDYINTRLAALDDTYHGVGLYGLNKDGKMTKHLPPLDDVNDVYGHPKWDEVYEQLKHEGYSTGSEGEVDKIMNELFVRLRKIPSVDDGQEGKGLDLVKLQEKFDKFFAEETEESFMEFVKSKGYVPVADGEKVDMEEVEKRVERFLPMFEKADMEPSNRLPSAVTGGVKDAVGFINWAMDNNYQCKIKNIIGGYEWYINDEDGVPIDYLTPEQLYKKYLSKGQPE